MEPQFANGVVGSTCDEAMTFKTFFALVLMLCSVFAPVQAQPLYRCGNTYSQTPCGADAQQKNLPSSQAPDAAAGTQGYELCVTHARKAMRAPDPASTQARQVGTRTSEVIPFADKSIVAHRYDIEIEPRLASGMYGNPVAYSCWLSEDQRRVLKFGMGSPR
jgi:hypothetical protein